MPLLVFRAFKIIQVRARLWQWYSDQRRLKREVVALQNLTVKMMGRAPGGSMGFHGAETNYVLEFTLLVLLRDFGNQLEQGESLRACGGALWSIREMLRLHPKGNLSAEQVQQFVVAAKVAMRHLAQFGLGGRPKVHELAHMANLCHTHGSPGNWSVWFEEGLNRWVARICNRAHRAVWHRRVLVEFEHTHGLRAAAKRQRQD